MRYTDSFPQLTELGVINLSTANNDNVQIITAQNLPLYADTMKETISEDSQALTLT